MKNRQIKLILIIFLLVFMTGCKEEIPEKTTLSLGGSNSGSIILGSLVEIFNEKYPDYHVTILPGTETKDGLTGVAEGFIDAGIQARALTEDEKSEYPDIKEVMFVNDAFVMAVHSDVNVTILSSEELRKIYTRQITNWNELGGKNSSITVLDRDESDSSKILVRKHILGNGLEITRAATILRSADSMNSAIEETPGSIGFSTLGAIKRRGLNIKVIGIDGIYPTKESINDGKYVMIKKYGLLLPEGKKDRIYDVFTEFLYSEEAQSYLEENGYIPVDR